MLLPALSRAEIPYSKIGQAKEKKALSNRAARKKAFSNRAKKEGRHYPKGRQSPKEGCYPLARPSAFSMKQIDISSRSEKAFSLPRRISLPSSSLSFSIPSFPFERLRNAFNTCQPIGSSRDEQIRALSCVALKKGPSRRSSLCFLPTVPA
ncbi:hypothetical protein C4D60_Mb08t15330 [Musa balbisiana]|uniref:Uncharacterized protein n=1 Tax=Musa balbisiana TaxID=52838 RepID=A0A4S8K3Y7_MUSBA|nr:hypothetical protein C4D60_Mb08t15330 [Musa balbisiana]